MVGYSGTPLPRKLGIAAGHRVAFAGAPKDFRHALGPLPTESRFAPGSADRWT
jgi:hypothetical protein